MEGAGAARQDVVIDWMALDGRRPSAPDCARRRAPGSNAIGSALPKGLEMREKNRFDGARRGIDLSADSA